MADTWINPGSPAGSDYSILFLIDANNDDTNRYFQVERDGGGVGKDVFTVNESATVYLHGPLERAGSHSIRNLVSPGSPVVFTAAGVEVARIDGAGKGTFATGGIRLKVLNTDPNGLISGQLGDSLIWDDGGTPKFMVCSGATSWSQA